jgi:hypothetical protein
VREGRDNYCLRSDNFLISLREKYYFVAGAFSFLVEDSRVRLILGLEIVLVLIRFSVIPFARLLQRNPAERSNKLHFLFYTKILSCRVSR